MVGDLKSKSVKGVIWSFVESASTKVIQFVISVIMARLLMPEDYGIVAIIFVFITISQVFIDGGFATTLIQDKYKTERDYSTIFTFNVLLSVCCYLILFFAAPYISSFYNNDVTLYLRVQSLGIIIFSFSAIHKVRMTVDVNFKAIAKVTVISALFSGVVGIILAFKGGSLGSGRTIFNLCSCDDRYVYYHSEVETCMLFRCIIISPLIPIWHAFDGGQYY